MIRSGPLRARLARLAFALGLVATSAATAAPTAREVAELCAGAEDQAHCGRLVEEAQLKRLPALAERSGDELRIALFPSGIVTFRDSVPVTGARTFALWDSLDRINAVVLFTTDGEQTGFLLVQRTNGRQYRLPSEPTLSPDRQYLVTADFCASGCDGELALWRVTRDDVRKAQAWRPPLRWTDATATWKDADTLRVEYTVEGETAARTLERRIDAAGWSKR
jgi:hypothetical protein